MGKAQQLQEKAASLPEHIAAEVLDFLEFLSSKEPQAPPVQPFAVSHFRGAFKGRLSSASEFAARKSDEIRLEE